MIPVCNDNLNLPPSAEPYQFGSLRRKPSLHTLAGVLLESATMKTTLERFWAKVDKNGPIPKHAPELGNCWQWMATRLKGGYGQFFHKNRMGLAHRASHDLFIGPIPAGFDCCHRCDNPSCVNPDHIVAASTLWNMRDASRKGRIVARNAERTHCRRGHEYSSENVLICTDSDGYEFRRCKTCRNKTSRARRVVEGEE